MNKEKEKVYLNKLASTLKNPPPNKYVLVYTERKDGTKPVKKSKNEKMTLSKLTTIVNGLSNTVNDLATTVNELATTVNELAKQVSEGFKRMDAGFKQVNNRLDYIVKANNLKDLPH